jgi:predicted AlkP superfamily pyrophosphatase or phosphodiesterase
MRKYLFALLAAVCVSTAGSTQVIPALAAPKLVLVISIDQMRFDFLDRFAPLYRSGLKTLLERGAVFTNAKYRHAATETGPGHSILLSGSYPRHSGIVGNDWWDSYLGRVVNVIDDPVQAPVGGAGRSASPANQLTFTVGDVLKHNNPRSRVVGVGLKDRSAILMGGRRADAAYWFENEGGNFITSTYYMDAAPGWLVDWNRLRSVDKFAGQSWTRLIEDVAVYEKYAGKDAIEGERDRKDITFPHVFTAKPPQTQHYAELRRTPFADEITLEFALEAMKRHELGRDADTDILAIGFAATDGIGHQWGPDSHEQMDQMLRLDALLGRLFAQVESSAGLEDVIVVLSADHGSRPLVEILQAQGVAARRVAPKQIETVLVAALAKRYPGATDLISHFATDVYLNEESVRRRNLNWKEVEAAAIDALLSTGFVERVYTHDDLKNTARTTDPYLELFRNAFYAPRSPHLNVLLKPGIHVSSAAGGTGHGSAYDMDRHVPVVFMGRGIRPGRYAQESAPEDIAPTLAHVLRLQLPREQNARQLLEMFDGAVNGKP